MEKKMKVCFIGNISRSFVKNDYEILKQHFDVDLIAPPKKKSEWLGYILGLPKKIRHSDLTFSWFAGWHSAFAVLFSKLFRKKTIIVVGGYDAACVPELNYGAFSNLKEKIPVKYIYKNASRILVVEPSLKGDIIKNTKIRGDSIDYIPLGYNAEYWKPKGEKQNIVLTVAGANNLQRVKLKGLDTFVGAARQIKEAKFIIIGVKGQAMDHLKKDLPKNVELIEFLPHDKLIKYYQMTKVYCQLSYREGLSSTLCEAMLCECIPVGSNADGIKTVIGSTGFYADYGDEKSTADMIKKALESQEGLGKKARERIKKQFSDDMRREEIQKIISDMKK